MDDRACFKDDDFEIRGIASPLTALLHSVSAPLRSIFRSALLICSTYRSWEFAIYHQNYIDGEQGAYTMNKFSVKILQ